jgi:hypothetical protein
MFGLLDAMSSLYDVYCTAKVCVHLEEDCDKRSLASTAVSKGGDPGCTRGSAPASR